MDVDESMSSTQLSGYQSAASKANAVARMYFLGNQPAEPLGPGSKEKKSALVSMGRFVGLELDDSSLNDCKLPGARTVCPRVTR